MAPVLVLSSAMKLLLKKNAEFRGGGYRRINRDQIFFWGDQLFLAGVIYFSGVRILPKGSHKSGGPINRNTHIGRSFRSRCRPTTATESFAKNPDGNTVNFTQQNLGRLLMQGACLQEFLFQNTNKINGRGFSNVLSCQLSASENLR